jgi:hypothetical protein
MTGLKAVIIAGRKLPIKFEANFTAKYPKKGCFSMEEIFSPLNV